jgi:hypothetical protein
MVKKSVFWGPLLGLLILGNGLRAQEESSLASYERDFVRAGLEAKVGVLRDATAGERASEYIGQFYEFSLQFCLQNVEVLGVDDPDFIALAALASRGAGMAGHTASVDTLWSVFSIFRDIEVRAAALESLVVLAPGNTRIVENINQIVSDQNTRFRSGEDADYPLLSACISVMAVMKDGSSVPVLLTVMSSGYSASLTAKAAAVLETLPETYHQYLIGVVRRNPPGEKLAAFTAAVNNKNFSDEKRGEMAVAALETALDTSAVGEEAAALENMRYAAAGVLGELKWVRAAGLVIRHYYRVQRDYGAGKTPRERMLDAIALMGVIGSSEAAQGLVLYMGYINSQMAQTGEFDDTLTLGIINALGELGDKIAFDCLSYINYLSYPEAIKNAAKEALTRLKW